MAVKEREGVSVDENELSQITGRVFGGAGDELPEEGEEEEEGEIQGEEDEEPAVRSKLTQKSSIPNKNSTVNDDEDTNSKNNKYTNNKGRSLAKLAVYIPPAKRRLLLEKSRDAETEDDSKNSLEVQRETWQTQTRVIHGTINRLNAGTIKPLIQELFQKVNLVRFRGVLCKSTLQAAISSPKYADVYAALLAVINSKLPEVGELATVRAVLAFRRYYKNRDKASCQAVCKFIAHLFHQAVVHELLILQILSVLLDGNPTDDSVEVAVELLTTTGQALLEVSPAGVRACLERLRSLLHEGKLNKRVEYKMEQLFKLRKTGFKDFPPVSDDLDLVERDDQITHEISLDDEDISKEENLDIFSFDPDYEALEEEWAGIRKEILGDDDSSPGGSDEDDDASTASSSESEASDIPDQQLVPAPESSIQLTVIQDLTEQELIHLRRTIYLTIMSSATFEECTHKLAKIEIPPGREIELINMLIECCSQERTFLRYYGLISARFCLLDDRWKDAFMESFKEQYTTIHRLETNKLRNVAKLFAHILHTDSIPWSVLSIIHLNEDETTSSSRIFIKIIIQEMAEAMGIAKLKGRFEVQDEEMKQWYAGMFPKDNVRNTRYAINFFTSIGLGPLTDDLREFLKNAPKLILAKAKEAALAKKGENSDDSSSVSSSSSSSSSSSTSSSASSSSSDSISTSSSSSYSGRRRQSRKKSRRRRSSSSSSESSSSSSSHGSYSSRSASVSSDGRRRRGRRNRASRSRSISPAVDRADTGESSTKKGLDKGGDQYRSQSTDRKGRRSKQDSTEDKDRNKVKGKRKRSRSRSGSVRRSRRKTSRSRSPSYSRKGRKRRSGHDSKREDREKPTTHSEGQSSSPKSSLRQGSDKRVKTKDKRSNDEGCPRRDDDYSSRSKSRSKSEERKSSRRRNRSRSYSSSSRSKSEERKSSRRRNRSRSYSSSSRSEK